MEESRLFVIQAESIDTAIEAFNKRCGRAEILNIEFDQLARQFGITYRPYIERREKWDRRFLEMAKLVASWSKDPSTKCGAVVVRPDGSIVSTGYNGFPRGCDDSDELYHNREEKLQRVLHAEVNAILQARSDLRGCTLYTWPPGLAPSCDRCATVVIQSGIKRIVYVREDNEFTRRWSPERSLRLYDEAGVEVTYYEP